MKAFLTTLFGDVRNCCVVAALIASEAAMVHGGLAQEAAFAVPVVILAGIVWLARPRAVRVAQEYCGSDG